MSMSDSLQAYPDCAEFFETVADDALGGRIKIGTEEQAQYFRHRCNQYRRLHRQLNARQYEKGHKMHGCSEYDPFALVLKPDTNGDWWLYAERRIMDPTRIELLSEIDDTPEVEFSEVKYLEHHGAEKLSDGNGH